MADAKHDDNLAEADRRAEKNSNSGRNATPRATPDVIPVAHMDESDGVGTDNDPLQMDAFAIDDDEFLDRVKNAKAKRADLNRERRFEFSVVDIQMGFLTKGQMSNVFLEFSVGGRSAEVQSTAEVERTRVDTENKRNKGETLTAYVDEPVWEVRVVRPPARRLHTRMVRVPMANDSDSKIIFPGQSLSGVWRGTYAQLRDESLTVRVWYYQKWGPNVLVGESRERLDRVADGSTDRFVVVLKRTQRGYRGRKQEVATVSFKFELEEAFDWKLTFQDWSLHGDGLEPRVPNGGTLGARLRRVFPCRLGRNYFHHAIDFRMEPASLTRRVLCGLACCTSCWWVRSRLWLTNGNSRDPDGTVRNTSLRFIGTRSRLEEQRLWVDVYKSYYGCFWPVICRFAGPKVNPGAIQWSAPLQGKIDYGHVLFQHAKLIDKRVGCLAGICRPLLNCADASDVRQVSAAGQVHTEIEPLYRQIGNTGRATGTGRFFKLFARNTYLCIKAVRAEGLAAVGFYAEALNPVITCDWLGVRKTTRVLHDTAAPFWDEWLFFRVPGISGRRARPQTLADFGSQAPGSILSLSVWHQDRTGARATLGSVQIGFDELYAKRKLETSDPFQGRHGKHYYVYRVTKRLHTSGDRARAAAKNRGSVADMGKHHAGGLHAGGVDNALVQSGLGFGVVDTARRGVRGRSGFDRGVRGRRSSMGDVGLDEMNSGTVSGRVSGRVSSRNQNREGKAGGFVEFVILLDRLGQKPIGHPRTDTNHASSSHGRRGILGPCLSLGHRKRKFSEKKELIGGVKALLREPLTSVEVTRAAAFWERATSVLPDRSIRQLPFCGLDRASGGLYYLTSFVSPLTPPSSLSGVADAFYFASSIRTRQDMGDAERKWSGGGDGSMAQVGGSVGSTVPGDGVLTSPTWVNQGTRSHPTVWSDPYFLLDQRQGCVRDRALLLCCLLLGLHQDAYVAVGMASTEQGPRAHAWVVSLEDHDRSNGYPASVRHYEAASGRTHLRWNPPRSDRDDSAVESLRYLVAERDERARERVSRKTSGKGREMKSTARTGSLKSDSLSLLSEDADNDLKLLQLSTSATQAKLPSETRLHSSESDDDGKKATAGPRPDNTLERKQSYTVESDETGLYAYSIASSWTQSRVALRRAEKDFTLRLRRSLQLGASDADESLRLRKSLRAWRSNHGEQQRTPYHSIGVLFNHKRLLVNLQDPDPEKIKFDLENPLRWRRLVTHEGRARPDGGSFYSTRVIHSRRLREEEARHREQETTSVIRQVIRGQRGLAHLTTTFLPKFRFQENLIGEEHTAELYGKTRLKFECRLGGRDPGLAAKEMENVTKARVLASNGDLSDADKTPSSVEMGRRNIAVQRSVWKERIAGSLGRDEVCFFSS